MSRSLNVGWKKGNSLAEDCVSYFREQTVFDKILKGFREKYASYGTFSGTVILRNLRTEEIEMLEGFFRRSFHGQKSVQISAGRFAAALKDSRFGEISPEELLRLYFGREMAGKQELKKREEEQIRRAFQKAEAEYAGTCGELWIRETFQEKNLFYQYLLRRYREAGEDSGLLARLLRLGAEILCSLPADSGKKDSLSGEKAECGRREYLPVFAARLTGNPHCFDDGTPEGRLLYQLLLWRLEKEGKIVENDPVFPALCRQKVYLEAGILKDDVSNYVMIFGVLGRKKDGCFHSGTEGFQEEGEAVMVPLSVLAGWESAQCPGGRIYIVENPSVFSALCEKLRGKFACMCMNGQPRLASVLLLDLLAKTGTEVFYAGDFDPEGLLIAQKVRQYYKGKVSCWHMTEKDYEASCSGEEISPRRLKILEHVADEELAPAAEAMKKKRRSGYQENIWSTYMNEEL